MFYIDSNNFYRDDLDNRNVMVTIMCITYNHEKFIAEALEGFINQKTNFRIEAIVHDDASTDGTAAIIREYAEKYPSIIKPIFETENLYSKKDGSLNRIMAAHIRGHYVAYCEGDDYWTDPLKLQKQVDYLENHHDCSLVCSNYDKFYQQKGLMVYHEQWGGNGKNGIVTFNDIILHNFIATLTVVVRANIYYGYNDFIKNAPVWNFGDYPLWLYASSLGYIMKFAENMAVYRVLDKSASHFTDNSSILQWIHSEFSMFDFFGNYFNIPKAISQEALFYRCNSFGQPVIALKDNDLINRIRKFYWNNHFYIAWLSFVLMAKFPRLAPISRLIESHLAIKAPRLYIKKRMGIKAKDKL